MTKARSIFSAACRSGEAKGIVASHADRLSRSLIDFAVLLRDAERDGYDVVALDLRVDTSTPGGRLQANIMLSVAQWQREVIVERVRLGLAAAKANGVRLGRNRAVPRAIVRRIKNSRAKGVTLAGIAERLNADQIPTSQGGVRWYPATARKVLTTYSSGTSRSATARAAR